MRAEVAAVARTTGSASLDSATAISGERAGFLAATKRTLGSLSEASADKTLGGQLRRLARLTFSETSASSLNLLKSSPLASSLARSMSFSPGSGIWASRNSVSAGQFLLYARFRLTLEEDSLT